MAAPRLVSRAARAVYRRSLRSRRAAAPAYADPMAATFDALLDRAAASGTVAVLSLLVREMGGLFVRSAPTTPSMIEVHRPRLGSLGPDLRFALRTFRRRPLFTGAVVATLALGIGANAAIFSVTKAVLLNRLPFADPARLVMVWEDASAIGFPRNTPAPGNYADWVSSIQAFDGLAAVSQADFNLSGTGEPEKIGGGLVTPRFFAVLGVQPVLGRVWRPDEDRPDSRLAVLNYSVWARRFGRDPSVIGRQVDFNGIPYTIIGVMPEHFEALDPDLEIWAPLSLTAAQLADRNNHFLNVVARLRTNVTLTQANAELAALATRLRHDDPESNRDVGMYAVPMLADYVGDTRSALMVLLVAVGCVLAICCVNVANLLLTQAATRARELAVRSALGADRRRLVRQLLTESVLLAGLGGGLGTLLAWPSLSVLEHLVPPALRAASHVTLDPLVLLATALLSVATGVLFGVAPAWRASQVDVTATTRQVSRGIVGGGSRLRTGLVVSEIALATVLLVGAGLLVESFQSVRHLTLGFRPDGVLTLRIQLPRRAYAEPTRRSQFVDTVLDRVRALPGVAAAGYTSAVPLVWQGGTAGFLPQGGPVDRSLFYDAVNRTVSPGYMETLGMTLREGRFFDTRDTATGAPVGIINETMARQYWPGIDPLGRRFRMQAPDAPWREIVGIVGDTRVMGLERPTKAEMYFPIAQSADNWMWPRDLAVRTAADPATLTGAVTAAIWSVDRNQPVARVQSMDATVGNAMQERRTQTTLLAVFAVIAAFLAAVGIYGVLSFAVTERTAEIGLRLALGGDPGTIRRLFVRRGLAIAALGLGLGLLAAFWGTALLGRLLFEVGAHDPRVFAAQGGLLAIVCAIATYVPARRASRVDPMIALRTD
jgi:putative ABC transport system permease protein